MGEHAIEWLETRAKDGTDFPYNKNVADIIDEAIPHCNTPFFEAKQLATSGKLFRKAFTWDERDFRNMSLRVGGNNIPSGERFQEKLNDFLLHSDNLDNLWYFEKHNIRVSFAAGGEDLKFERISKLKPIKLY